MVMVPKIIAGGTQRGKGAKIRKLPLCQNMCRDPGFDTGIELHLYFLMSALSIAVSTALTQEWTDHHKKKREVHIMETIIVGIIASLVSFYTLYVIFGFIP